MELSRVEHILKYFLGEEATLPQPLSRVEELLIALGELIEEGKVTNPISIRGRVDTVGDLPSDAEPGWLYFVGLATDTEFTEYIYLDSGRWEYLGTSMISVDTALSTTSTNPVQNSTITNAINTINELLAKKPGEITTGKQYTIDGQTVTADTGAETFNNLVNNKAAGRYSHAEGSGTEASGAVSHSEGSGAKASGAVSHAEGSNTTASALMSHAEGSNTTASGVTSHAEGSSTTASGVNSHAEGITTIASGDNSHSEGYSTTASSYNSHAEGSVTRASGAQSHAEGSGTTASGANSHAEGLGTKASSANQHAQGKYNVEDANDTYAFIIGNGTADNARHNAFAIDWNGLIYVNGAATGVNVSAFPSPADINTAITKANAAAPQSTTYTKTETDTALNGKVSTSDVITTAEIDEMFE